MVNGKVDLVSNSTGKTTCGWFHPNNLEILFASTHLDSQALTKQKSEIKKRKEGLNRKYAWDYDENFDLFIKNISSDKIRQLTFDQGYDAEASISPDGKFIIYTSNRELYQSNGKPKDENKSLSYYCDLYLYDFDLNKSERVTWKDGYDGGPFFNGDGSSICWRRFSEDGYKAEIFSMNLDDMKEVQLTKLDMMSWAPYFHPSDEYLIFSTNIHGYDNFELYVVDRLGRGSPVRVTKRDGFDGLPTFSNDGKILSWTSNQTSSGNSQIFMADWNHDYALKKIQQTFTDEDLKINYTASNQITNSDLLHYSTILCDKRFNGRMTGTLGMKKAAEFTAAKFEKFGLQTFWDHSWHQEFPFVKNSKLTVLVTYRLLQMKQISELDKNWTPMNFSDVGVFETQELVFAGYGLQAKPKGKFAGYNSYTHLDVKNKWVLVLSGVPEHMQDQLGSSYYGKLTQKASLARDLGAKKGIVIVNSANNQQISNLASGVDHSLTIKSFVINKEIAINIFKQNNRDLEKIISTLNQGEDQLGFPIKDIFLKGDIQITKKTGKCINTIGYLKSGKEKAKTVIIGAHLDHLGTSTRFSRSKNKEDLSFHPGADDNISGISALLEIAQKLSFLVKRGLISLNFDIIFCAWSGEEIGLLGSSSFVDKWKEKRGDTSDIIAYLNMDMIGRYVDNLTIHGIGSAEEWSSLIQQANIPIKLSLNLQKDSYIPTDTTSFVSNKIPIISGFTGLHNDYHSTSDTPEKINYNALKSTAELFTNIILNLNDNPNLQFVSQKPPQKSRTSMRSYLGTIPNYGLTDVTGVALSGVASGGPADKAGLKSNDIVIQLNGQKIESIYDYTNAIGNLSPNNETTIMIQRGKEQIILKITPTPR